MPSVSVEGLFLLLVWCLPPLSRPVCKRLRLRSFFCGYGGTTRVVSSSSCRLVQLGVLDAKLGGLIKDALDIPCVYNPAVLALVRGIRGQVRGEPPSQWMCAVTLVPPPSHRPCVAVACSSRT